MNFTLGNHLVYTIAGQDFGQRSAAHEKYSVRVGKADRAHLAQTTWQQEQLRTASAVYQDLGKDFFVMFSGGTDSEIVIRSFLKIGIKPKICFIRFSGGYNDQDFAQAQRTSHELDLPLYFYNFDPIHFYKSGAAAELASQVQCSQLAYLVVYAHIKQLAVPAVMGGEALLRRHVSPRGSQWYFTFRENEDASAMRFSLQTGIPVVNEWFSYTPEMLALWIQNAHVQRLMSDKNNGKLSSVSSKNNILLSLCPELSLRDKTHGYEKLMGFNGHAHRALAKNFTRRLSSDIDGIFIDHLRVQLGIEET